MPKILSAESLGRRAYLKGDSIDDCPYPILSKANDCTSSKRKQWMDGFIDERTKERLDRDVIEERSRKEVI
jgi:ribosome modulation factor